MIDMSDDTKIANPVSFHHLKVDHYVFISTKVEEERLSVNFFISQN